MQRISSHRQGEGTATFESFPWCCSGHITAVGFLPASRGCQPSTRDRGGTHRQPQEKRRNTENLSNLTLKSEISCNLKQHLRKRTDLDQSDIKLQLEVNDSRP